MDRKPNDELSAIVSRIQEDVSRLSSLTLYACLTDVEHKALVSTGITISHVTKDWRDGSQFERAHMEAAE